jgi:AraC-like DNA-binding protein
MEKELFPISKLPGIVYSHFETQKIVGEQFIGEHGLCYIISGNLKVTDAGKNRTFSAGDLIFYRKNFLAKFVKQPVENHSFRSVTVVFDRNTLLEFSKQYDIVYEKPYVTDEAVLRLEHNMLLENFYKTLIPYFDSSLPDMLVNLKKQEALMLLLQVNPKLKNVLFDFSQPGKIDLEAFMQQNFRFNVDLKNLAFLTGRSLAAFKRDFEKIFHTSPNRWLQQRRLEEAHYLIKEKSKRPSDVYHEVGFETISHFSYSFKQFFGVNPSNIP